MSKEYWMRIRENLKHFCKLTDAVTVVKIFHKKDSQCQLCGHRPITQNFVIMNSRTHNTMVVGNECVFNYTTAMKQLGITTKVLFPDKFKKDAESINHKHYGTAKIIAFPTDLSNIESLITSHDTLECHQLDKMLTYLTIFTSNRVNEVFHRVLDIWVDKHCYNTDFIESGYKDIKEWAKDKADDEIENYWMGNSELSYEESEYSDADDLSPEGTGIDEIDWDSHDFE